ncbi:50S ribosomal protein L30 [Marinomonas agarivorans]|nr:50S ribosomal protein L30 [Marinomonas agarivorans]
MAKKTITVELTRSPIGRLPKHRETIRGLGLSKVGQRRELEDTPSVRGMVNKVYYMVKVVGE